MTRWIWLPAMLAVAMLAAIPRLFRRAFAPPQRAAGSSPHDLGLAAEHVWLESANRTRLHGWYIPVEGLAPAVIVLHGWGSNASMMLPLAVPLHEAGFHALFLDARNHGLSEHDSFVSMPRFAEDLEVGAGWLGAHPSVTSIGVIGHSVGAGAAILAASRSDVFDSVVSVSSFAHPGEMMREQMGRIPSPLLALLLRAIQRMIGHRFGDFAPRNRIAHVSAPMMLVHGDADHVIPITNLRELTAAQPGAEIIVVPGGGHSDLARFEPYFGEITGFLDVHLWCPSRLPACDGPERKEHQ